VQKTRDYILLIEAVPGGKGEDIDAAQLAVWRIRDELFDRAYRLRFRRSSQSREEAFDFAGELHGKIK
jgi:hypothetical protein